MTLPRSVSVVTRELVVQETRAFAVHCRPETDGDITAQARAVYERFLGALAVRGRSPKDIDRELLFVRDAEHDLPRLLEIRDGLLGGRGAPAPTFIQQPPSEAGAAFELLATATLPLGPAGRTVRDVVPASGSCGCPGCARSGARIVEMGGASAVHTTNVYGTGSDAFEQAWNAFRAAEAVLAQCGFRFADVVRTWIHLRDIDRDYAALNRARREFFRSRGIERRPASTGVQGGPFPAGHDISVSCLAVGGDQPVCVQVMSTPSLNEAWSYGADFSRGLRVEQGRDATLLVSGTASIDEAGRSVHVGDLLAQGERMLHNIGLLLGQHGASFPDVVWGIVYLRHADAAPALRALFRQRGFDGFPCAVVEAPLCRPELLCEAEVVAVLPLTTVGA